MNNILQAYRPSYLWFSPPLILGGSVISAGTIHDLRRVKVQGTGPLWNPCGGDIFFSLWARNLFSHETQIRLFFGVWQTCNFSSNFTKFSCWKVFSQIINIFVASFSGQDIIYYKIWRQFFFSILTKKS